jgi:hypothetical protein
MHRPRRVPDDARRNLLVDRPLPIAAVGGEDHGRLSGKLDQQRLMAGVLPSLRSTVTPGTSSASPSRRRQR